MSDAPDRVGEADLRPALHRDAIAALAGSPLPALLDSVQALQKALLGSDPRALRRSVGWFGRLLGRDIGLQAQADAISSRLGVHLLDARRRMQDVVAHRDRLAPMHDALLEAAARLLEQAEPLAARHGDPSALQRMQVLVSTAHAYRISASHLELTMLNLDRLIERVGALMPRVELLLEQRRALHDGRAEAEAISSAGAALDTLRQLVQDHLPPPEPAAPASTTRSTP